MILLGLWLAAVGVGDAVAGMSGEYEGRTRAVAGVVAATVFAFAMSLGLAYTFGETVLLTAWVAASSAAWVWVRVGPRPVRAGLALAGFGTAILALVVSARWWPEPQARWPVQLLEGSPFGALATTGLDRAVLLVGAIVFLFATSNAVVRLVLVSVGSDPMEGETRLKGGRIIGPMERWLIFGFALAGSLPAAALVVTAKGLVRFRELGESGTRVHEVTEYFLIGSLSSWLLALLPVVLLLQPGTPIAL